MRRVAIGAVLAVVLAGCAGSSEPSASSGPHYIRAREHIAEMCAEARLEGKHLQGCRDFYKLRGGGE